MALLSRLHWWTVEYGLIGSLEKPKIYGAGLLSSIGESVSCLEAGVKKIPYSIDAANQPFDITTKQPQLFVCRDFKHLADVLEEFASKMAFMVGGLEGINKAIECNNIATCQYSSGLQVTGVFDEVMVDANNNASPPRTPIYLHAKGPCALAYQNKELAGHGRDYHKDGFGSPIGRWKETDLTEGKNTKLEFESGITVEGKIDNLLRRNGDVLLITFSDCTAKYGDRVLFDPSWGIYDMAVGDRINSVFNGAADKDAYNQVALVPKERTIKVSSTEKRRRLESLYAQVRRIRESKAGYDRLGEIWETQQAEHPDDWLLSMEIFEILDTTNQQPGLKAKIEKFLNQKKAQTKDLTTLISWGFRLVEYHKRPEYQAALHASPK
jgi:phenylalanine-4-hydroxylase